MAWKLIKAKLRFMIKAKLRAHRSFEMMFTNRIRAMFTTQTCIMRPIQSGKACKLVLKLLEDVHLTTFLRERVIHQGQTIALLQKRIREKLDTRLAKCNAILEIWTRFLFKLSQSNSKQVRKFCNAGLQINMVVKSYVIHNYIVGCQFQYLKAFSQWRHIFNEQKIASLMLTLGFEEKPKFFQLSEDYLIGLFKEGGDAERYFGKEFNILNEIQMKSLTSSKLKPMVEAFAKCVETALKEQDPKRAENRDFLICSFD